MFRNKVLLVNTILIIGMAMFFSPNIAQAQDNPVAGTTLENLMTAFNGESNANARYLAFAKKADEEGYAGVASLFRAAARAEQVHFEHHTAAIRELGAEPKATIETPVVKSTLENLQAAIDGETYESTKMYPAFLKQAKKDKNKTAITSFEYAEEAEAVHARWYKQAKKEIDKWKTKRQFEVCPKCGNVVDFISGPSCPICFEDTKKFITVT
ncbi:MAG: ferritin family protein [Candidatus Omnitrophica bacterium]|nr:ferritin family protein [Candidatus Omnitrophota bacterium]